MKMLDAFNIIKTVVLSEKASTQQENYNQYTFKVDKKANKIEIAKAIEKAFGVKPIAINTANFIGKKKRYRGKKEGRRAHWKKAIVTLNKGDMIDTL